MTPSLVPSLDPNLNPSLDPGVGDTAEECLGDSPAGGQNERKLTHSDEVIQPTHSDEVIQEERDDVSSAESVTHPSVESLDTPVSISSDSPPSIHPALPDSSKTVPGLEHSLSTPLKLVVGSFQCENPTSPVAVESGISQGLEAPPWEGSVDEVRDRTLETQETASVMTTEQNRTLRGRHTLMTSQLVSRATISFNF